MAKAAGSKARAAKAAAVKAAAVKAAAVTAASSSLSSSLSKIRKAASSSLSSSLSNNQTTTVADVVVDNTAATSTTVSTTTGVVDNATAAATTISSAAAATTTTAATTMSSTAAATTNYPSDFMIIDMQRHLRDKFSEVNRVNNVKAKFLNDEDIIKFSLSTINQFFNGPRKNYDVDQWKTEKVFEAVVSKLVRSRNVLRRTHKKSKRIEKKVKPFFHKSRFWMCLKCWQENRYFFNHLTYYIFLYVYIYRSPNKVGILTSNRTGTKGHNKKCHSDNNDLPANQCLPIECDFLFEHVPRKDAKNKLMDKNVGKEGERPNYQLKSFPDYKIPENIDDNFYEFVQK